MGEGEGTVRGGKNGVDRRRRSTIEHPGYAEVNQAQVAGLLRRVSVVVEGRGGSGKDAGSGVDGGGEGGPVLNLLLVDDSRLNRRMLARLLSCDDGYRCDEAEDGVEAVRLVETNHDKPYDAILMDFMMPNMDGPTATKAIREMGYKGLILGVTGEWVPRVPPTSLCLLQVPATCHCVVSHWQLSASVPCFLVGA